MLFSCAVAVAVFAFVLMVGNIVRDLLGLVLAGQLEARDFVRLTLLLVPFVLSYALPMGILTGVLLTLGSLSADNEITAMRSAGLSLPRIARPVFVLATLGIAAALYINFESMPWARVEYDKDVSAIVRENPLSFIVPKTFIRNFPGVVVYVGERRGPVLKDLWLWQLDDRNRAVRLFRGQSGRLEYNESDNEFVLTLVDAQAQTFDDKAPENFTDSPPLATFERSDPIHLSLNRIFGRVGGRVKPDWMTYAQLRAKQAQLAAQPAPPGGEREKAKAEMKVSFTIQNKINTAFAVFSFAVIGIPLGIKVSRRETSANLGVAVALALGYYFLTVMVSWLDQHPEYRPDVLIWVPNLIFIGLGLWLFRRLDRP